MSALVERLRERGCGVFRPSILHNEAAAHIESLEARVAELEGALDDGVSTLVAVRATARSDEWGESADHFSRTCLETIQRMNKIRRAVLGERG